MTEVKVCPQGHEISGDNAVSAGRGYTKCRRCYNEQARRRRRDQSNTQATRARRQILVGNLRHQGVSIDDIVTQTGAPRRTILKDLNDMGFTPEPAPSTPKSTSKRHVIQARRDDLAARWNTFANRADAANHYGVPISTIGHDLAALGIRIHGNTADRRATITQLRREGLTTVQIADRLGISRATVDRDIKHIRHTEEAG